jgi:hypothetical protein
MNCRVTALVLTATLLLAPAARADVVQDWNTIMLSTVAAQSPFAQARSAAITQLAVFEAVNACSGAYRPYLGSITAPPGASAEAAAVAAAHKILTTYFFQDPKVTATLDAAYQTSLLAIPDGPSKTDGIGVGVAAANAMIALRANDGSTPLQTFIPTSTDPGVWQPTPPGLGPGLFYNWRNVTPFAIESSDQFRLGPPPALTSERYRRDYDEVKTVGELNSTARPQDRADVARFYAAASPVAVWNSAAQQVTVEKFMSLSAKARAFALLNMAASDALVAIFETKYFYVFWRPVTAIRAGDVDGNPKTDADPGWLPFITTPSFPSYASAHAAGSGAAAKVLELIFGSGGHTITLTYPTVPGVILQYTSFRQITDDIDDARVFGGIHFRFDQEEGGKLGRRVGRYVIKHQLRRADRE